MESKAAYDILAKEYYDPRHKTTRNFDSAAKDALGSLGLQIPRGLVLEVGSGRGRCGEYLGIEPARVVQLDNSAVMLSLEPRETALVRILHDAEELPFPDGEFACVTAFLCDPFLGLNFLAEARRVLSDGGILIGTTPSEQWGRPLRGALGIDLMETRFVLVGGQVATLPSAIYSNSQLFEMLVTAGFLESSIHIGTHTLPAGTEPVSDDILKPAETMGLSPYSLGILCSFMAEVLLMVRRVLEVIDDVSVRRKYRIGARFVILILASGAVFSFSVLIQQQRYLWSIVPAAVLAILSIAEFILADLIIDARFPPETVKLLERLQSKLTVHDEIVRVLKSCVSTFNGCDKERISSTVHLRVDITTSGNGIATALVQLSDYTQAGLGGRRWRTLDPAKGLVGRCLRLEKLDWVNFRSIDEYRDRMVREFGFTRQEVARHTTTARSYLTYPIEDKGKAIGVIYFFSTEPQVFPLAADLSRLIEAAESILGLLRTADILQQ